MATTNQVYVGIARDSRYNWEFNNPVIPYNVLCIEDEGKMKVGSKDLKKYNELPYLFLNSDEYVKLINNLIASNLTKENSGVAASLVNAETLARQNADAVLQNQIIGATSGFLGSIPFNSSAPTPGKNGEYSFSSGGVTGSWFGGITVKSGDRLSVIFLNHGYTYTLIDVSDKVSTLPQILTEPQKTQVLNNLGAVPLSSTFKLYAEQISIKTTGSFNSDSTNSSIISVSASTYHTNIINCISNQKFVIQGITAPTIALGVIVKYFGADTNHVSHFGSSVLTAITGGYLLAIPSDSMITNFGFNFNVADLLTVSIKEGETVEEVNQITINDSALPTPLKSANVNPKLDAIAGLITTQSSQQIILNEVSSKFASHAEQISSKTTGSFNSASTNSSTISVSASTYHTNIINCIQNQKFVIQGITAPTIALGVIVKYFGADTNHVSHFGSSVLTAITGGYLLTIPSDSTITNFGFNFNVADLLTVSIKAGETVEELNQIIIQDSALPTPLKSANINPKLDAIAGIIAIQAVQQVTLNDVSSKFASHAEQISSKTTGAYPTTTTNSSTISVSASTYHTNIINCIPNQKYVIQGITSPTIALSIIVKYFSADTNHVSHFGSSVLTAITGGYLLTIPSDSTITNFGFNFNVADLLTVSIKAGETVLEVNQNTINDSALPTPLKSANINSKLDAIAGLITTQSSQQIILNEVSSKFASHAEQISSKTTGAYPTTTTNSSTISVSASTYHANIINCIPNQKFVIQGITAPTIALSIIVKYFSADTNHVSHFGSSVLTAITGGYLLTIPSDSTITNFGFNFNVADLSTVSIKAGETVEEVNQITIQDSALPTYLKSENIIAITNSNSSLIINSNIQQLYERGLQPKTYTSKKVGLIVAGQSNTEGRVLAANFPLTYVDDLGVITNYLDGNNQIPLSKYCKSNVNGITSLYTKPSLWAYDGIVLSKLCHKLNDTVYMLNYSMGGTAISTSGTDGGGFWTPRFENIDSYNISKPDNNVKLCALFEQQIRTARSIDANFEIKAFLWHQGEGDSTITTAENDYYKNLSEVIAYVRGVVGNPILPVIFGTISHNRTYSTIVEAAFHKIDDEDPFVHLVDMSAATLLDAFHFDATWSEYLGNEMYKIIRDSVLKL